MITPWEKLDERLAYDGFRKIVRRLFRLPDGNEGPFDIIKGGKVACILPITAEGNVVLAKQFRPGPEKILLELPGGGVDPGEEPIEAAARELLEETGYAGEIQFVKTSIYDAYSTYTRYNFVAINCRKIQEPTPGEHEWIEVVEMPIPEFYKHLCSGELTDVTTGFLGLAHLGLIKQESESRS